MSAPDLLLVMPNGARLPLGSGEVTLGRGDTVTVRLDDQTVSRLHARIVAGPSGPMIEDAGSRYGTFVGARQIAAPELLSAGTEIRIGNVTLHVEGAAVPVPAVAAEPTAEPAGGDPNATIVVPIGATAEGLRAVPPAPADGLMRPRVRSGWALKRLEEGGEERWILRDLRGGNFLRMASEDVRLFELIDGRRTVAELLVEATRVMGPAGTGRLARLIADFGERGLLDGIAATPKDVAPESRVRRVLRKRDRTFDWIGGYFERAYGRWGHIYFSPLAVTLLALLSIAGLALFTYLIGARYGTPFIVAHRVLLGGAVFVLGRFALVLVHELAHGLALTHYGRRTDRAGLRIMLIFPYAFVDTSEAYFESRLHRIVIAAAGPVSDFSLAAIFTVLCAISPRGSLRDVLFQLAFGGYVGAFFNANPFLDRDGYQILCDYLREPDLKAKAKAQLSARLSGQVSRADANPVLLRYSLAGLIWSLVGAGFVAAMSLRYYPILKHYVPSGFVLAMFIGFFVMLLIPVVLTLGVPMLRRAQLGTPEVNRVVR